ncbi:MAG: hypothetical protein ABFD91_00760 [Anaerohalosphaeraceae bacterium]
MTDYFHKITNWIDHNRGQFFGVLIPILAVLAFLLIGCSTTQSIHDPKVKVDRQAFAIEALEAEQQLKQETIDIEAMLDKHNAKIAAHNDRKEAGLEDLNRQDERKSQILEIASGAVGNYASGGTVSGMAVLMSLLNLAGIGWGIGNKVDNVRKDQVIAEQKQVA